MKFGSLFSGIGGLDLGLERAGMECAWQVEIDDYATRVLERHWPNVPRWRDIADFVAYADNQRCGGNGSESGHGTAAGSAKRCTAQVDLICGGFPCQPVSLAGARRGDSDERWLWPAFRRVVDILDPRYVVIENVPGLISADAGRLFRGILRDLSQSGYDAEWQTLPAAAFGAPHLRERIFIVAYFDKELRGQKRASKRIGQADQSLAAHANGQPLRELSGGIDGEGRAKKQALVGNNGELRLVAYANESRSSQRQGERSDPSEEQPAIVGTDWRTIKPTVCRGNHGISHWVDRLRGLGNAVVPQVAEWIGRRIMAFHEGQPCETKST